MVKIPLTSMLKDSMMHPNLFSAQMNRSVLLRAERIETHLFLGPMLLLA